MQKFSDFIKRFYQLAGVSNQYAIEVIIHNENSELIHEHQTYKKFKKSQNRYTYHPEDKSIPVKAHYHVYPNNSKKELYAVNVEDGTAHHKKNRGYEVPKKEAEELRKLGVAIPDNRILEHMDHPINENADNSYISFFILISSESDDK